MMRRTLALAVCLALTGISLAPRARAETLGVTIGAIPIYIIAIATLGRGCLSEETAESEYARDGFYAGAGGSYGVENFGFRGTTDNSPGVTLRGGYRCHPSVSGELQAEYFTGFDSENALLAPEVDAWVLTGNSRMYPFTRLLPERFQPYLLAGIGAMHADKETGIAMRFGGGLDFYATPHFVLTAGFAYLAPYEAVEKFDTLSLGAGLEYRF